MRHQRVVRGSRIILAAAAAALFPLAAVAQSAAEVEALRKDVEALKRDVGEMRSLLEEMRQQAPQRPPSAQRPAGPVKVSVAGGHALGKADAPVTIVELSDFQCPFCQRYAATTFPELKRDYVDTGKVRYVLRDFPLDSIHPDARKAAEAAHCAGDQGKYWEMHEALFRNIRELKVDQLKARARALRLDEAAFGACLDGAKHAALVSENRSSGTGLGVTGTPTFFIGKALPDGTMEATRLVGAQPIAAFRKAIDSLLEK